MGGWHTHGVLCPGLLGAALCIVAAPARAQSAPGSAPSAALADASAAPWTVELKTATLVIESRARPGEELVEVRAVGTMAAPPAAVEAVVDDHGNYAAFMPYVSASRILATDDAGRRLTHQVLAFPVVSARDYVVWLEDESQGTSAARVYRVRWRTAQGVGPAPAQDVVRMPRSEGYWQVEQGAGPHEARVTYRCFTDPGGALPSWVVNLVNRGAIEAVFAAVERRAVQQSASR